MIDYVLNTGPLSICLDASEWNTYIGGVVTTCTKHLNHCVQIVGINTIDMIWKVRNQWGIDWGENGYIYIKAGDNLCGLATDPTFVIFP